MKNSYKLAKSLFPKNLISKHWDIYPSDFHEVLFDKEKIVNFRSNELSFKFNDSLEKGMLSRTRRVLNQLVNITGKLFIEKNKDHDLAGSAQYWYGETFRIRQLYSDAATAYLDGYQNYPKSQKAPDNLLKLGITMVQLGEKDQGCKMISGLKKEYPKASKSVLQKAQYEQKKFKCNS